jgi:hypothetical protein
VRGFPRSAAERVRRRHASAPWRPSSALAVLLAVLLAPAPAHAQESAPVEICGEPPLSECVLPASEAIEPFSGETVTLYGLADRTGDGSLDLLGASWGWTSLEAERGEDLRRDRSNVVSGARRPRATSAGEYLYVRLDYSGSPEEGGLEAGLHVALGGDGQSDTNAAASRADPGSPLPGSGLMLSWFPVQREAFSTDFSTRAWYRARAPFLVIDDGGSAHFLVGRELVGSDLLVASFVPGSGWDLLDGAFRGRVPVDGVYGLTPDCASVETSVLPDPVDELQVNGEVYVGLALPLGRTDTACFPAVGEVQDALSSLVDGEAVPVELPARATVSVQGERLDQAGRLRVEVAEGRACLTYSVGLTRAGYHAITALTVQPTGSSLVDTFLSRAAASMIRHMPPGRADEQPGVLLREGDTRCGASPAAPAGSPSPAAPAASPSPAAPAASPSPAAPSGAVAILTEGAGAADAEG